MGYKANNMGDAFKGKRKNPLVDDIIDKDTLADYIGCEPRAITYYQKEKGLPFIPLGRDTYFSVKSVYKWLMKREQILLPENELKKEGKGKNIEGRGQRRNLTLLWTHFSEITPKRLEIYSKRPQKT